MTMTMSMSMLLLNIGQKNSNNTLTTTISNTSTTLLNRRQPRIVRAVNDNPMVSSSLSFSCMLSMLILMLLSTMKPTSILFVDGFSFASTGTGTSTLTSISTSKLAIPGYMPAASSSSLVQLYASSNNSNNDDKIDTDNDIVDNDDANNDNDNDNNKFDMTQRIESVKSIVLGALSGGLAVTPIAYLHYVTFATATVLASSVSGGIAQWEFVTDMSSIEAGLFAIVYRYAIRKNDNNPMLNQGVVGAFIIVRSLSNIQVTDSCQSIPLRCGPPLGYFDWNMIEQGTWNGIESVALFGVAAGAMELAFQQKW
eukprot:CAMPEP_0170936306 /NCGR_PEP_ID=MMETSP0735-20130129/19688_1 /TAXON_ID=186038 /ORGANISM="Fragilariopsis kerguelensis, Strain L26-C5" /LENGTH=310 /DNA_ID=CAMNT_0011340327 /DNA_START=134 /DNA_END=1064 /DNA_ORIENTATION=-